MLRICVTIVLCIINFLSNANGLEQDKERDALVEEPQIDRSFSRQSPDSEKTSLILEPFHFPADRQLKVAGV